MTQLIPASSAPLAAYVPAVRQAVEARRAPATRRAYATAWAMFRAWCEDHGVPAIPAAPEALAAYLTEAARAGRKASTLIKHRAAVRAAHLEAGRQDPGEHQLVTATMAGLMRTIGAMSQGKAPVLRAELVAVVSRLDRSTLAGARDAALILVGFAGGFRRSELTGLDVADLRFTDEGLRAVIRRSKTDQEGRGKIKHLPLIDSPLCPVSALRAWLDVAGIRSGPVFRRITRWGSVGRRPLTDQVVALKLKQAATLAGMDARQFAGHSLRSGFATDALGAGQQLADVAEQLGHASLNTTMKYKRDAGLGARRAARAALMGE